MKREKKGPRNATQKALDQELETRLRSEGKSLREIAKEVGVAFRTVLNDLNEVDARLNAKAENERQRYLDKQLAELEYVRLQAKLGWERSLEQSVKRIVKESGLYPGTDYIYENQNGNPGHLRNLTKAVEVESKLLGLLDKIDNSSDSTELDEADKIIAAQLRESRERNQAQLEKSDS